MTAFEFAGALQRAEAHRNPTLRAWLDERYPLNVSIAGTLTDAIAFVEASPGYRAGASSECRLALKLRLALSALTADEPAKDPA